MIGFRKLVPRNAGCQRLFEPVLALSLAALICLGGIPIDIRGIAFYAWHVGESTGQSVLDHLHRCPRSGTTWRDYPATTALALANPQKGRRRLPFLWGTK